MSQPVSVKVSSCHHISVPRFLRDRLGIESGGRLLVNVQTSLWILLPLPDDHTARRGGLRTEAWAGLDTIAHVEEARDAWRASGSD